MDNAQVTETQEQSLDSVYSAVLPLRIEHKHKDTRPCRWHIVDSAGSIVECFQSEEKALAAMHRVTDYWS